MQALSLRWSQTIPPPSYPPDKTPCRAPQGTQEIQGRSTHPKNLAASTDEPLKNPLNQQRGKAVLRGQYHRSHGRRRWAAEYHAPRATAALPMFLRRLATTLAGGGGRVYAGPPLAEAVGENVAR